MKQSSVNDRTNKLAPQESMKDLRRVLPLIISTMAESSMDTGLCYFSKYDIKDSYWQLRVIPDYSWKFAYVLPRLAPEGNINET